VDEDESKNDERVRRRKEKIGRRICRGWKGDSKSWKKNMSCPFYDDV
jgi:hypothetical protein